MSDETRIETADVLSIDAAVIRSSGSEGYGITETGFLPKPFARLLAEKLALARELLGENLDLTSGSAVRKLLEISALEDARTWSALASMYDSGFVVSATGEALSRLGEELGLPRPYELARGKVTLSLDVDLPAVTRNLTLPRGARMLTPGGHHVATDETVVLSPASPERDVSVTAFYPGPDHNLNPSFTTGGGTFPQKIDRWNYADHALSEMANAEAAAGLGEGELVGINHAEPLTGGEFEWSDVRYRRLLLQAPRSLWRVEAIQVAVSLIPGVRQVQVRDGWGGLDISESVFGTFNFIERLFSTERDLGSPYYFTVLVAPTPAAIWEGPDGLRIAVESAMEDLRPISIFPNIEKADEIGIGISARLTTEGMPLPTGSSAVVNSSEPAVELKRRLLDRVRRYIDVIRFGEPVRWSEVLWALMNEPGVADVTDLKLLRFPPGLDLVDLTTPDPAVVEEYACGQNIKLSGNQVPVLVEDDQELTII